MNAPTKILYGEKDNLTSFETMKEFADKHKAHIRPQLVNKNPQKK